MTDIDYAARKNPNVYKPLLDAEFAKLAEIAGTDLGRCKKSWTKSSWKTADHGVI